MPNSGERRDICWYCGGRLIWNSDFNYDEVYGEGDGIVTFLRCMKCGADVTYALAEIIEYEEKAVSE